MSDNLGLSDKLLIHISHMSNKTKYARHRLRVIAVRLPRVESRLRAWGVVGAWWLALLAAAIALLTGAA